MAREQPQRTDDELRAFSGHLLYEIEMLAHTASWLYTIMVVAEDPDPKTPRRCATRCWSPGRFTSATCCPSSTTIDPARGLPSLPTLSMATGSSLRSELPPVLRLARAKASKEVAHLPYGRAKLSDSERTWHLAPILVELSKVRHRFLETVPDARLRRDFGQRALAALPDHGVTMSPHGLSVASSSTISLVEFKD